MPGEYTTTFAKGEAVTIKLNGIGGTVSELRLNGESVWHYRVNYMDLNKAIHSFWFTEAELQAGTP